MCRGELSAIIAPLISSVCEGDGKDTEELQLVSTLPCSLLNHECSVKENPDKETFFLAICFMCITNEFHCFRYGYVSIHLVVD